MKKLIIIIGLLFAIGCTDVNVTSSGAGGSGQGGSGGSGGNSSANEGQK